MFLYIVPIKILTVTSRIAEWDIYCEGEKLERPGFYSGGMFSIHAGMQVLITWGPLGLSAAYGSLKYQLEGFQEGSISYWQYHFGKN